MTTSFNKKIDNCLNNNIKSLNRICSCSKTKCIKKYCECLSNNQYCYNCNCIDCHNKPDYTKKKFKTIEKNKNEEMSGNTEDQNVAEIFRDISKDNTTSEKFPFSNRSDVSDDIRSKNENNENKNKKNNNNNDIEDNKKKLSQLKITNSEGKEENWNIEED